MGFFKKKKSVDLTGIKVPRHIGFIMDGNGRWAKKRGLPRNAGHRAGVETLRLVIRYLGNAGVEAVTFYAFSTENWKRPSDEVNTLMRLFIEYFNSEIDELDREGAVIRILGEREGLSPDVLKTVDMVQERTRDNTGIIVNIAFNYGGRDEIVRAARLLAQSCVNGEMKPSDITEDTFADRLFTRGCPDPDLIVRTSEEKRVSNFMLYQLAYSEFEFPKILWPDVDENALASMILEYSKRDRRYGAVRK